VLVARQPASLNGFPSSISVGIDGSTSAMHALAVARELGHRLEAPVRVLAATGGKPVDFDGLRGIEDLDWDELRPVDALAAASRATDLVVLGSRGLHGMSALGSVSERVAHRAASSVLVVRAPQHTLAPGVRVRHAISSAVGMSSLAAAATC
jgi:nucleotide-binding universal stress UspA family protein